MGSKKCNKCGIIKPKSAFQSRPQCLDGLRSVCRHCREMRRRELASQDPHYKPRGTLASLPAGERFEASIERIPIAGCWIWTRALQAGYGSIGVNRRYMGAHRFAYERFIGPIPPGMVVCHRCDVPACCNPSHLFVATQADNMRDMARKGRHWVTKWARSGKGPRWTNSGPSPFKFSLSQMITVV